MSKFRFLAGLAGALVLSAGVFSSVPSAHAGREFNKSDIVTSDDNATRSERRANRAERRAKKIERRANRSERRVRRSERRARRSIRRANRGDGRASRQERRARRYDRKRHGKRHRNRRHGYNHQYNGFYYAYPWWLYSAPGVYYGTRYAGSDYELHVEWCEDRYRSYNERRDAFKGYDGFWHACISPYS